ncbi:MAG: hypothetical protein GDA41_10585 [Rhodospirillales bacterium]|nr:hypothetical protein [Rhodospirillales bacterium]
MMVGTWEDCFPFAAGEKLNVEVKIMMLSPLKGKGSVLTRSDDMLSILFELSKQTILGQSIPQIDIFTVFTYREEGGGNIAVIEYNGLRKEDRDLKIVTDRANKSRRIEPSVKIAKHKIAFTLRCTGESKVEVQDIAGLGLPFDPKIRIRAA